MLFLYTRNSFLFPLSSFNSCLSPLSFLSSPSLRTLLSSPFSFSLLPYLHSSRSSISLNKAYMYSRLFPLCPLSSLSFNRRIVYWPQLLKVTFDFDQFSREVYTKTTSMMVESSMNACIIASSSILRYNICQIKSLNCLNTKKP